MTWVTFVVQKKLRFDVLDFYRYAGALVVAAAHFIYLYLPVAVWVRDRVILFQPLMGLFFTLSGFVIMHVYQQRMSTVTDYLNYMKYRLARIYPLHVTTLALFVTIGLLISLLGHHAWWFNANDISENLLLVHAWNLTHHLDFNYPSWSVSAEFFVYLLFPVFLLATNLLGAWGTLVLALLFGYADSVFFQEFHLGPWNFATYNFGCLRAVPSFLAGMAVYRLALGQFSKLVVPAWLAHGMAIATIPMMWFGAPSSLVLVTFVLVIFALAKAEPSMPGVFSKPLPRALANCSYGFYMLHAFVAAIMIGFVAKVLHLDDSWKYGLAVAAIPVTTALSVASFRFFETPTRKYLSAVTIKMRLPRADGIGIRRMP